VVRGIEDYRGRGGLDNPDVKGSGAPFLYSEKPFYVNKIKCYILSFPQFFHFFEKPVEIFFYK
jgi:hypothetical protein